jgi:hypothetical protein
MPSRDRTTAQRFYYGIRADLKPGDLIAAGYNSNYGTLFLRAMYAPQDALKVRQARLSVQIYPEEISSQPFPSHW